MEPVNITQIANQIDRPFALFPVAILGHLAMHVYVCVGMLDWHTHLDEDELFLVHEGVITLETEIGAQTLHAEELAVVPKGVAHRSGSLLRSVVLLIRPIVLTHRINGRRRTSGGEDSLSLEKHRLARLRQGLSKPYRPVVVAGVEDYRLKLGLARGISSFSQSPRGGLLLLSLRGELAVYLAAERALLAEGEVVVLPAGKKFYLEAENEATYLLLGPRGD